MNHLGLEIISNKTSNLVNILATASPKTKVMKTGMVLVETVTPFLFGGGLDQDTGAAANAVQRILSTQQGPHLEEVT